MMCAVVTNTEPATGPLLLENPKSLEQRKANFMKYCYCVSHVGKKLLLNILKWFYKGDPDEPYNTYFFTNYNDYDYGEVIPSSQLHDMKTKSASDLDFPVLSLLVRLICSVYDEVEPDKGGDDKYKMLKDCIDGLVALYLKLGTYRPYLTDTELNDKLQFINRHCCMHISESRKLGKINWAEFRDITDDLTLEIIPLCTNPKIFYYGFIKEKAEENWATLIRKKEAAEKAISTMPLPERLNDDQSFKSIYLHKLAALAIRERQQERLTGVYKYSRPPPQSSSDDDKITTHANLSKKARKKMAREKKQAAKRQNMESHQSIESSQDKHVARDSEPTASTEIEEPEVNVSQTSKKSSPMTEAAKTQEEAPGMAELSNNIKQSIPETTHSKLVSDVALVSPPEMPSMKGKNSLKSEQEEMMNTSDIQAVRPKGKCKETQGVQSDVRLLYPIYKSSYTEKAMKLFGSNKLHSSNVNHNVPCFVQDSAMFLDHEYSLTSNPWLREDKLMFMGIDMLMNLPFTTYGGTGIIIVSGEAGAGKSMLLEYISEKHETNIDAIDELRRYPIVFHCDLKNLKCKTFQELVFQFASNKGLDIGTRKGSFMQALLDFPILLLLDSYDDNCDEITPLLREIFGMIETRSDSLKIIITCRLPYVDSLYKLVPKSKKRLFCHVYLRGFQIICPYALMEKLVNDAFSGKATSSTKVEKIRKGLLSHVPKMFDVFRERDFCNALLVKILTEIWLENPLIE